LKLPNNICIYLFDNQLVILIIEYRIPVQITLDG